MDMGRSEGPSRETSPVERTGAHLLAGGGTKTIKDHPKSNLSILDTREREGIILRAIPTTSSLYRKIISSAV